MADAGPTAGTEGNIMDEEQGAVTPLSELLSAKDGAAPPPPAPEPEKASEPPPPAEPQADPAPPAPPDPDPKTVPVQSYHAEKTKRQELEKRVAELEGKLKAPPQEAAIPDVFDPAFTQKIGETIEARLARQNWENRVAISTAAAKIAHKDYDAIEAIYIEEVNKGRAPRIPDAHPMPAEFAYEIGKQFALLRETGGDLDSYRAKLRSEIEAELKANQAKAEAAKKAAIMPTTAGDSSAAPDKGAEGWSPRPLSELLKAKNRR